MVKTETLKIKTQGNCDVVNITEQVGAAVGAGGRNILFDFGLPGNYKRDNIAYVCVCICTKLSNF